MNSEYQQLFRERLNPRTIDAVWADHQKSCKRCALWEETKPATLMHVCPEGVNYVKVLLAKHAPKKKRERIKRPEFWASKEEVKRLMRYVE